MPTVAPTGDGAQPAVEKRDGGTVVKGGNVAATSPMTNSLSVSDLADDVGQSFGSKVIAQTAHAGQNGLSFSDHVGVSGATPGAITAGTTVLGYQADATEWVVKGGNVATTLGGVANTTLIGGAAGPDPVRDNVAELETTRDHGDRDVDVLAVPASGFNSWITITGGGSSVQFIDPEAGDGTSPSDDKAANTTRAVPGQLVYMQGGKTPKQDTYKAKDAPES